jgi:hypothetical protein
MEASILDSIHSFLFDESPILSESLQQEAVSETDESAVVVPDSVEFKKPVQKLSTKRAGLGTDMHIVVEDSVVKLKEVPEAIKPEEELPAKSSVEDPLLSEGLSILEAVIEDKVVEPSGNDINIVTTINEDSVVVENESTSEKRLSKAQKIYLKELEKLKAASLHDETVYPIWDAYKAKPEKGYYFPIIDSLSGAKPNLANGDLDLESSSAGTAGDLRVITNVPMPGGPAYMDHR